MADTEGSGGCRLEYAEAPLLVLRDEERTESFPSSFENSLTVLGLGPGFVRTSIFRGLSVGYWPTYQRDGFDGAGWVTACEGPLWIDDRFEEAPSPTEFLAIPFFRSARGERMRLSPAPVRVTRVDSWRIDDVAGLKARGWQVQNVSKVVTLESAFPDGTSHSAPVACHLNAASWRCPIPPDNLGIRLRKTYDRFHGRQRVRVFIDGEFAGWWYEPIEDRHQRWAVAEYGIPETLTRGKSSVQITIDPPAGSPLWSVSDFEVFALTA